MKLQRYLFNVSLIMPAIRLWKKRILTLTTKEKRRKYMNIYINEVQVEACYQTIYRLSKDFSFCVASSNRGNGAPEVISLDEFSAETLCNDFGFSIFGFYSNEANAIEACERFKEDYLIWVVVTNVPSGYVDYYSVYSWEDSYCSDLFCSVEIFHTEEEAYMQYVSTLEWFHKWLVAYDIDGNAWIEELTEGTIQHAIGSRAYLYGKYNSLEEAEAALADFFAESAA